MDQRTHHLIKASVLATRYEWREDLREHLSLVKSSGEVLRPELYECFLQLHLFCGFPGALEAMRALQRAWPDHHDNSDATIWHTIDDLSNVIARGKELYERIYQDNAEIVRQEMLKLSPELAVWAVVDGYGKTLSRDGLDVQTRELAVIAVLAQLGWDRQLFSHILGAVNVGVSSEDIQEAITCGVMGDSKHLDHALELLRRVPHA